MAEVKATKMVLKVDLQCPKCCKTIKKVLCCCPQIRNQVYDQTQNMVTITVVCCSPENIRERIICKAGDMVESIEIVPDKPKEPEKKKEPEKTQEPPKPEKPKVVFIEPPQEAAKPLAPAPPPNAPAPIPPPALSVSVVPVPMYPVCACRCCCYKGRPPCNHGRGPMCNDGCGRPACKCSHGNRGPVVPVPMYPVCVCRCCCYEGGPCNHGQGPMYSDGCGQPAYECSHGNRGLNVSHCDEYFSEENALGCSVM